MILVNVTHYLNEAGIEYFPAWFDHLKKCIQTKKGFIDIGYSIEKNSSVSKIILFFNSNENLNTWAKSKEHDDIIGMLDQYRNQPWISKRCRILDFEINQPTNNIELIGYNLCPFTQRINIILNEKNISYKITYIDILNKPEWFTKISPFQEIPILIFNNKVIFKSNVICEFLNDELGLELYPKQNIDTANSRAWIEFGNALIMDIYNMSISSNKKEYDDRIEFVYKKLDRINTEIKTSPYFYGKTFTMIDTCYAPILSRLKMLDQLYKMTLLDDFENLENWRYALTQKNSISSLYNENYLEDFHNFLIKKNSYIANKEKQREKN